MNDLRTRIDAMRDEARKLLHQTPPGDPEQEYHSIRADAFSQVLAMLEAESEPITAEWLRGFGLKCACNDEMLIASLNGKWLCVMTSQADSWVVEICIHSGDCEHGMSLAQVRTKDDVRRLFAVLGLEITE